MSVIEEEEYNVAKGWKGLHMRDNAQDTDGRTNLWVFACPTPGCYQSFSGRDEADARARGFSHLSSGCKGSVTHFGATVTRTLIEECFVMADHEYDVLVDGREGTALDGDRLQQQRGVLKGMCQIIAVWMGPWYPTTQDVAEEIRKRKTMRDAGQHYDSPGLESRRYQVHPSLDKVAQEARTPAKRAEKVLTEQERTAIKFAHNAMPQQFTTAILAAQYEVTEAVIVEVCR